MKMLGRIMAAAFVLASLPSFAANTPIPYLTGPQDVSQFQATINQFVIQAINNILVPLQPNVPGAVNFISLTPSISGLGPIIGIGPGGDANSSLKFVPNGNGNIILFSSDLNINSTGVIKVGNLGSWVPMQGIAACPGVPANRAPFGMTDHITGYLIVKDYLDRPHGMPGC